MLLKESLKLSTKNFLKNILKVLDCLPGQFHCYFLKSSLCEQYFEDIINLFITMIIYYFNSGFIIFVFQLRFFFSLVDDKIDDATSMSCLKQVLAM